MYIYIIALRFTRSKRILRPNMWKCSLEQTETDMIERIGSLIELNAVVDPSPPPPRHSDRSQIPQIDVDRPEHYNIDLENHTSKANGHRLRKRIFSIRTLWSLQNATQWSISTGTTRHKELHNSTCRTCCTGGYWKNVLAGEMSVMLCAMRAIRVLFLYVVAFMVSDSDLSINIGWRWPWPTTEYSTARESLCDVCAYWKPKLFFRICSVYVRV